jgi:hypothetical protein
MKYLSDEEMQAKVDELSKLEDVQEARVVEFLGEQHIHVDYTNGNIGISQDGESILVLQV